MSDLTLVSVRDANQDFSGLVARVEASGEGFLITKRGRPVARLLPLEGAENALTAEQQAVLDRLLGDKLALAPWEFDRDELYDR